MPEDPDTAHPRPEESGQPKRAEKAARVRTACSRCQRRKMRCDGVLPSCKPCQRAGASCTRIRDLDSPKESKRYIAQLKSRIAQLESNVPTQGPDVIVRDAPSVTRPAGESVSCQPSPQPSPQVETQIEVRREFQSQESHIRPPVVTPQTGQTSVRLAGNVTSDPDRPAERQSPEDTSPASLDHELGLVSSSAGVDSRYVGASSGYYFTKLMLGTLEGRAPIKSSIRSQYSQATETLASPNETASVRQNLLKFSPSPLPKTWEHARELSCTYFDTVHLQFPFLYRPSYEENLRRIYFPDSGRRDHGQTVDGRIALFQTYLVLAISSAILSRRVKIALPSEGYAVSALECLKDIDVTASIKGLQCTQLLLQYALNSRTLGLNLWYLHYQCVASLVDLGLHCGTPPSDCLTVDEQMKRRVFMSTYTFDQTLATIMGRPNALRDEDCNCEPPEDVSDESLTGSTLSAPALAGFPSEMSNALHLFRLARINSEIKHFLHPGPSNSFSTYTNTPSIDLVEWQESMLSRLRQWAASVPSQTRDDAFIVDLSEIKYHNVVMLLLRPSPAIRNPSEEALRICYESATHSLRMYNRLYKRNVLTYTWVTVHTIFLTSLTMLYCVWTMPDSPIRIRLDVLVSDLKAGSDVLSATGEHWPQATRCRDALENLSNSTIRWLSEVKSRQVSGDIYAYQGSWNQERTAAQTQQSSVPPADWGELGDSAPMDPAFSINPTDFLDLEIMASVFGGPSSDVQGVYNANTMLQGMFCDYQPTMDF